MTVLRRGRPPLDPSGRRVRLEVRLSGEDRATIAEGADRALDGDAPLDTEADWIRAVLLREARYQLTREDPAIDPVVWPIVEALLERGLSHAAIAHGLRAAAEAVEALDSGDGDA